MYNYSERQWLNPDSHPSTGSVVAYRGEASWLDGEGKPGELTMLEIADCHGKVRLHQTEKDSLVDFISKMELLRDMVDSFIVHLRSEI